MKTMAFFPLKWRYLTKSHCLASHDFQRPLSIAVTIFFHIYGQTPIGASQQQKPGA